MKTIALVLLSVFFLFTGSLTTFRSVSEAEKGNVSVFFSGQNLTTISPVTKPSLMKHKVEVAIINEYEVNTSVSGGKPKTASAIPFEFEEKDPAIEDWMTDPAAWIDNSSYKPDAAIGMSFEFEENNSIEKWMTEYLMWNTHSDSDSNIFQEMPVKEWEDEDVRIEEWMTKPEKWITK